MDGGYRWDIGRFWDRDGLFAVPEWRDAGPGVGEDAAGQRKLLYQGMALDGVGGEVFAYIGYPSTPAPPSGYPAVVMVQGGSGTAYHTFAGYFNRLGFATIAMDLYNCFPERIEPNDNVVRQPLPGQSFVEFGGDEAGSRQVVRSIGNAVLAHSLLRSMPGIDADRIGMVGISWGSVFSSVVSAIDSRLKIIVPVYGHGFYHLGDGSQWFGIMAGAQWDPCHYLHASCVPLHWIGGTNDAAFFMDGMQRSYDEAPSTVNHSYLVELIHGHCGYRFPLVRRILEHSLSGGPALPRLGRPALDGEWLSAEILDCGLGPAKAVLCHTADYGPCLERKWSETPAEVAGNRIAAKLPPGTVSAFFSIFDQQEVAGQWNCCGSSDLAVFRETPPGSHPLPPPPNVRGNCRG